jgi:hypothetical protein
MLTGEADNEKPISTGDRTPEKRGSVTAVDDLEISEFDLRREQVVGTRQADRPPGIWARIQSRKGRRTGQREQRELQADEVAARQSSLHLRIRDRRLVVRVVLLIAQMSPALRRNLPQPAGLRQKKVGGSGTIRDGSVIAYSHKTIRVKR